MPGFNIDGPGNAVMVAGSYIVKAVQTQVILQGPADREIWLGVDPRRGGAQITGWVQSGDSLVSCRGELQAIVTGWQG